MEDIFLGIDLGTSAMKMVLVDGTKHILAQITEEYQAAQPKQGWNEIDPENWYACMKNGIKKILENCARSCVRAIGVTGQMHTLVVLGEDGRPVRPAMMWNDIRTKDLIAELRKRVETFSEGKYLARTISTGSPAANLYWLKKYEPHNFEKIRKFLIGPDYLVYRLTGQFGTDYCEASTSCLYEIKKKQWSEQMRELIGLSREAYPPVRGSVLAAGRLSREIAELFSLREDTEVLVGTGDNPATAISTGCLGRGYPVISLGTSGVFMTPVCQPRDNAKGKVILFSFDDVNYSYLVQGAVQSNGSTLEWWVKNIMEVEDFSVVDQLVCPDTAWKSSVLFYPHLVGDKTLYADPNIRGGFFGLSTETTRSELLYSVIEGLCFSFRELAEKMELPLEKFGSVKVVGGGARSRSWMQTMANVLNIRIEQMDGMTGPAYGIALLAAYHCGSVASLEQISEGVMKVNQVFEPVPAAAEACEKKYEKYLRIHKGLRYIMDGANI